MKRWILTALTAALIAVGCGEDQSPSGEGDEAPDAKALQGLLDGSGARPATTEAGGGRSGEAPRSAPGAAGSKRERGTVPTGVPLDPKDPGVQKAIAELVRPRESDGSSTDRGTRSDLNVNKVLKELLNPKQRGGSDHTDERGSGRADGGLGILDQLK